MEVLGRRQPVADHDIQLPLLQVVEEVRRRRHRMHEQLGARRQPAHTLDDIRQEEGVQVVRRAQVEGARGGGRVELLRRAGDAVHRRQALLGQRQQLAAALGRHHAVLASHQNGVAGDLAQALQRVADGGLRLAQAHGSTGHALLGQQGVQHPQQISIEMVASVHGDRQPAGGGRMGGVGDGNGA
ncbi:hypothetical protein D3C81_998480 [compost metagenome]